MASEKKDLSIGVFDSGMGGLTILNQLHEQLPNESFIYLGDTARLPYGTKSPDTVLRYAIQMTEQLVKRGVKMVVVACNTASAIALAALQQHFVDVPIIGVIESGADALIAQTQTKQVAVLATASTVASAAYTTALTERAADIQVISYACGLFVGLAEEGWTHNAVTDVVVNQYLLPLYREMPECDCVLLACTHFPVLKAAIERSLGPDISVINPANTVAEKVLSCLNDLKLTSSNHLPTIKFLVTDLPERFIDVGKVFFQKAIARDQVTLIDIGSDKG